jgi:hypothetical protein
MRIGDMSILSKVTDFVGGSLFKEIKEGVMAYFPPDMSPQQKAEAELKVQQFLHDKAMQTNQVLSDAATQLDQRISEQEGTAKDLLTMPVFGRLVLFLRGLQRPLWGFATMYMDQQWFFGKGVVIVDQQQVAMTFTEQQQTAMIIINVLVLGFLFGERTIKNLEPLIIKVFAK